ncbi:MAG: nodulation S family protein [Actinomycetota bacterium]|nr:nodulation S family protein [Actinomycetota bacterium]
MTDPHGAGSGVGRPTSTPRSYFENLYHLDEDPWGFTTSTYEARKYAVTLASLPDDHYRRAFEPGCSIGVLTEGLASRCDTLHAVDFMEKAAAAARARTAGMPGVLVERRTMPEEWPEGPFDLIVLSELAYYFDADGLRRVMAVASRSMAETGVVVGVHWRGTTDYPLNGDQAHAIMGATPNLEEVVHHLEDRFVLDMWRYRRKGQDGNLLN